LVRSLEFIHFLEAAAEDAAWINENSDVVQLIADRHSGKPPARYHGLFWQIEHLERSRSLEIRVTDDPIPFTLDFPEDYLRSSDRLLLFRVIIVHKTVFHPNQCGSRVQMGEGFKPGTQLHSLLHQLYRILSGRVFATEEALDAAAYRYYEEHRRAVERLTVPPLYRRPDAVRTRFMRGTQGETDGEGEGS
jgi:hypothetical protein